MALSRSDVYLILASAMARNFLKFSNQRVVENLLVCSFFFLFSFIVIILTHFSDFFFFSFHFLDFSSTYTLLEALASYLFLKIGLNVNN